MLSAVTRRALTCAASVLLVAGCSHGASSIAPSPETLSRTHPSGLAPAGYRVFPGPAVAGPLVVPIATKSTPGYIAQGLPANILYVADANNNVVLLYNAAKVNPKPIGKITSGINVPIGLAVDKNGVLYVVNIGNATVTEYAHGKITPNFTISSGMNSPYGIAVDASRNVFVSNLGNNTVTGYHFHAASPYETIGSVGPNPVGVAADHKSNVYVCDDSDNTVYEIKKGSSTAINSGLTGLGGPIGIAFAPLDAKTYVSDFGSNEVAVYVGSNKSTSTFITNGINQPTLNGFAKPGNFFQSDQTGPVEGYHAGKVNPYSVISGIGRPLGIAAYPRP